MKTEPNDLFEARQALLKAGVSLGSLVVEHAKLREEHVRVGLLLARAVAVLADVDRTQGRARALLDECREWAHGEGRSVCRKCGEGFELADSRPCPAGGYGLTGTSGAPAGGSCVPSAVDGGERWG